jgi:hypothetical protein
MGWNATRLDALMSKMSERACHVAMQQFELYSEQETLRLEAFLGWMEGDRG